MIQVAADRWMIEAPAKLNLGLRVFPARPDGFHDIETWMAAISLHDTVQVECGTGSPSLTLEVTGRADGIPTELEKNLVGRAALKLATAAGIQARGRIVLHKVVPPGGGLGGGSSDAAKVLVVLNEAWKLNWDAGRLEVIAAELGSDVPFFVRGRASLCTGRGEIMTPLPGAHPLFAVLLIPPIGCPTKAVYQAFDAGGLHRGMPGAVNWQQLAQLPAHDLDALLVNDLEAAAFSVAPPLAELQKRTASLAGRRVHITGSGSTLFILRDSGAEAGSLAEQLSAALGDACVCVPVRITT